jgi:hypothetical protein
MFLHEAFKDVSVEVFARIEGSSWVKMTERAVERRIGSHSAERFLHIPTAPVAR